MNTSPLPCPSPWCFSTSPPLPVKSTYADAWRVQCSCGVMSSRYDTEADALRAWNTKGRAINSTSIVVEAAANIMDRMMGGHRGWRDRMDESKILESADWDTALEYATAALAAGDTRLRSAFTVLSDHFEHGWGDDTRHGVISDVERIAKDALK